ncbi:MAG: TonB-dependent receptor plug domain-containing protein, partial [Deltaproteobacteria bacterium]|nr:TonB-dependent receptor plug domain-containing protein [Deltaproteobacteria bacterium]
MSPLQLRAILVFTTGLVVLCGAGEARSDEPRHADGAELFITADPLAPSALEYGSAASVISREQAVRQGNTTIGEALGTEAGVSSTSFGPGASRPVIRGNAGDRIRVLQNGVGTFDLSSMSEDHAVTIDPSSVTQFEILRGPETLLYGSNAIGGLVNMSDDFIPESAIGSAATGEVNVRTATADDQIYGAAKLRGQAGNWNWALAGFNRESNDLKIPGDAESERLRAQEAAEALAEEDHAHDEGEEEH